MTRRSLVAVVLLPACSRKKPAPPPAARTAPRPVRRAPAPKPAVESAPAVSPRQLGQMLTPAQAAQASKAYTASAQAAERSLSTLAGRRLTREQVDAAGRVRSLLRQAADIRDRDVSMAARLAGRAEVLARDLAGGAALR